MCKEVPHPQHCYVLPKKLHSVVLTFPVLILPNLTLNLLRVLSLSYLYQRLLSIAEENLSEQQSNI